MATILSALEIAQLSAMIHGGGYKRSASKDAAVSRFYSLASDKGIAVVNAAQVIEAGSFEAAKTCLSGIIAGQTEATAKTEAPKAKAEKKAPAKIRAKQADRPLGKRAQEIADAEAGILPSAPDFSAETHKPFRKKLADLVGLVQAKDIAGLKAYAINPISSSPKALDKYRNLAVIALGNSAKQPAAETKRLTEQTVDEYNAGIIAEAVEFTVARKGFETKRFESSAQAISVAEQAGIGTLVYAISKAGRSVLLGTMTKDGFAYPKAKPTSGKKAA
jgi:hypothetical protein